MNSSSVVLLEKDPRVALSLVRLLQNQFDVIRIETSCDSLREDIVKQRASLAIIDVENAGFEEIHRLHLEFPHVSILCTHRLADEAMWAEALSAGASDLCDTFDLASIVRSAVGEMQQVRSAVA